MEDKNNNLNEQADMPPSTLYLWRLRTLYVGYLDNGITFSAGAHTLLFGLEDDVLLEVSGEICRARTLLLPGFRFLPIHRESRLPVVFWIRWAGIICFISV